MQQAIGLLPRPPGRAGEAQACPRPGCVRVEGACDHHGELSVRSRSLSGVSARGQDPFQGRLEHVLGSAEVSEHMSINSNLSIVIIASLSINHI
jgi:hypothetical protein